VISHGRFTKTARTSHQKAGGVRCDASKRDQFGRDPECPSERLRNQTDYEADTGYAPLYHARWRICRGCRRVPSAMPSSVCNMLSFVGEGSRLEAIRGNVAISAQALADLCGRTCGHPTPACGDGRRGMIRAKMVKRGEYAISLLYRDWQGLEDYAVWKRKQVVAIDEAPADEARMRNAPISKDAVRLFKQLLLLGLGATRAFVFGRSERGRLSNESSSVDAAFSAVVQWGGW